MIIVWRMWVTLILNSTALEGWGYNGGVEDVGLCLQGGAHSHLFDLACIHS